MTEYDISEFRDASEVVVTVGMPRYGDDTITFQNPKLAYRAIGKLGALVNEVDIRE